jgi:hypothetical protein
MPEPATRETAREACHRALEEDTNLRPLSAAARNPASLFTQALAAVPRMQPLRGAASELQRIRHQLEQQGLPVGGGAFERFLVVHAALGNVDRVPALPVDDRVKELFYRKFTSYAAGAPREPLDVNSASFASMCLVATLNRFPAGQLDWVPSGVPRSWLVRVPRRALPRLLRVVALELGGFAPAFFTHLDPHRPNQGLLLERESLRSYHRIARSMAMQPAVKGLVTASWFHSPDTFAVSPHLAWVNDVFLQHGGHVFPLGPVDPECGALYRSPERRQAYENGAFTPTEALVIWPRRAMLAWAADRADLRDAPLERQRSLAGARA